ncbi:cytochrome-c oxidase, cbb3-type subunit III [Yoonia sp.]|uniref:cytochrome-c oxidase, cbb3-type subunit III n=1 Tax=Yoonia sp. TaxID=2212373 RepID=UPI001A0192E0|nr:cytochrome-c oxidase, cbb3-type subunit III [Yoonia sp.]MBE0412977.1 cytochrome-c oxidase, cbb3-type subunit III [Yoonia sp.]
MSDPKKDEITGVESTGHSWDGIEELNNPLPRWWLWTLYLCIIWAIGYTIAYPAWPGITKATSGLLGYSTRGEVAEQIAVVEARNAPLINALTDIELAALPENDDLHRFAVAGGGAIFRTYCSQCHGSGAAGATGYPNLLDDDWLWGGKIDQIATTIRHGIRNDVDPDALWSQMPAFGDILEPAEINDVVQYVRAMSGQGHDAAAAEAGSEIFLEQCSACHGEDGKGNRDMGAPNLTDAIWLYGGSVETLTYTVTNSRFGVMPPWSNRLSEAEIKAVAAYVHQLGGGEE